MRRASVTKPAIPARVPARFATHLRVHAERLVVIKEACGNAAVTIASGLAVVLFGAWLRGKDSWYPLLPVSVVSLALAFSLWRMHVIHVDRYGRFVENTIAFRDGERGKGEHGQRAHNDALQPAAEKAGGG